MTLAEICARVAAALFLAAACFAAAHLFAARLADRAPTLLRWTATLVAGLWLSSAAFHLLARFHVFTLPVALAAAAALAAWLFRRRAELAAVLARDRRALALLARGFGKSPRRGRIWAFAALTAIVILRPLILPPLGWDALTYHALKAGVWVQAEGLVHLHGPALWSYVDPIPGGAEVYLAWGMLPFHGDLLSGAVDSAMFLALALALLALARELGAREPYGTVAVAFILALPTLRLEVGAGYSELPLYVSLAAGFALALRAFRTRDEGLAILAAAALGVACAVKVNAFPLAALALLLAARPLVKSAAALACAVLAFALVSAPWLIDTTLRTGLPLTPFPVRLFGVPLGHSTATLDWLALSIPGLHPYTWPAEWAAFKILWTWELGTAHETLTVLSLLPVPFFLGSLPYLLRRRAAVALLTAAVVAVVFATFYSRDFVLVRLSWPYNSGRWIIPAFLLLVPASFAWCRQLPSLGRLYADALLAVAFYQLVRLESFGIGSHEHWLLLRCLVALVLLAALARALRWASPRARAVALFAGVVLALGWTRFYQDRERWPLYSDSQAFHDVPRWFIPVAFRLDGDEPQRLAVTVGPELKADHWLFYPFLGRRLQNQLFYVPVSRSGEIIDYDAADTPRKHADRDAWVRRIEALSIDTVVALHPPYLEIEWMEAMPDRFQRIAGTKGEWGAFRVKK